MTKQNITPVETDDPYYGADHGSVGVSHFSPIKKEFIIF